MEEETTLVMERLVSQEIASDIKREHDGINHMNSEKQPLLAPLGLDAHILTWNPAERDIHDSVIEQYILDLENGSSIIWNWNVGRHKNGFKTGNLVYLLRQGTDRRGIIASGVLIEDGVQKGRFDHDPTRESNFVRFQLQTILSIDDRLDFEELQNLKLQGVNWSTHFPESGRTLKGPNADALFRLWGRHYSHVRHPGWEI